MQLVQAREPLQYEKMRSLYETAFPEIERKPFSIMLEGQKQGKVDMWCLQEKDQFCGLAAVMKTDNLALLDYFAIEEQLRGQSYGAKALRLLQQQYRHSKFFLEIETTLGQAPNQVERENRKQFYLKNGMKELGILANVYHVDMELLGFECELTYEEYKSVYTKTYGRDAGKIIRNLKTDMEE